MDPQPPTAPFAATSVLAQQHHHHPQHRPADDYDHDHVYNEKDAYHDRQPQYPPRIERASKASTKSRAHDSVISSNPLSPLPVSPPSPASSLSSAKRHRPTAEIQHAHRFSNEPVYPPCAYLDPEKAEGSPHRSSSPPARAAASNPDVTAVLYDSGEYLEKAPEDKPVQLLLFLSGPCALLSFAFTVWTIFALFIALALQPFRLISTRPSLSKQLTTFLAPALNLQLHLIYSYSESTDYSAPMLVVIHLFSPFVAVGVAIAAWTAAFFWFFSIILGDPAGQDSHNDGKDSILGVRNWWDRWLSRALR